MLGPLGQVFCHLFIDVPQSCCIVGTQEICIEWINEQTLHPKEIQADKYEKKMNHIG
jgi:hypothetical protein